MLEVLPKDAISFIRECAEAKGPDITDYLEQNLAFYCQIHAARKLCSQLAFDFDFRKDYWYKPEVRLGTTFLHRKQKFFDKNRIGELELHTFASKLKSYRKEGLLDGAHGLGRYDATHFCHDVRVLIDCIDTDLKGSREEIQGNDLLRAFSTHLQKIEEKEDPALMDVSLLPRILQLHYFTAPSATALKDHAHYLRLWYTMLTSTNACRFGGMLSWGPVLGNNETDSFVRSVTTWSSGTNLAESPLVAHDADSTEPYDVSHYMSVLELYAFCRLSNVPIINKPVLDEYLVRFPGAPKDPATLQLWLGNSLAVVADEPSVISIGKLCWDQHIDKALQRIQSGTQKWRASPTEKEDLNQKGIYDNDIRIDLRNAAQEHLKQLTAEEMQRAAVHLLVDAAMYQAHKRSKKETQDSSGPQLNVDEAQSSVSELAHPKQTQVPLNQILQGPPGTGKTYSAVFRALEIIDGHSLSETIDPISRRRRCLERFKELKKSGRIEMITFHPGYGYEDFVEGISPDLGQRHSGGGVHYQIRPGVLREIVERMTNNKELEESGVDPEGQVWKVSLKQANRDIASTCLQEGWIGIDYSIDEPVVGEVASFFASRSSREGEAVFRSLIEKMNNGDLVCVLADQRSIQAVGVVTGEYHYAGADKPLPHRRQVRWIDREKRDVFAMNGNKLLVQTSLYELTRIPVAALLQQFAKPEEATPPRQRHVLIIDEMNRANLNTVFGELITLLEKDKREGAAEETQVKLIYSRNEFTLPKELYLIGTMNTADRSLTPMDMALRRRFHFTKLAPMYHLVPKTWASLPIRSIIQNMNIKIAQILGDDLCIGHSYFMTENFLDLDNLRSIWFEQILPLLADYSYGDKEIMRELVEPFTTPESEQSFTQGKGSRSSTFTESNSMNDVQFCAAMNKLGSAAPEGSL